MVQRESLDQPSVGVKAACRQPSSLKVKFHFRFEMLLGCKKRMSKQPLSLSGPDVLGKPGGNNLPVSDVLAEYLLQDRVGDAVVLVGCHPHAVKHKHVVLDSPVAAPVRGVEDLAFWYYGIERIVDARLEDGAAIQQMPLLAVDEDEFTLALLCTDVIEHRQSPHQQEHAQGRLDFAE